MEFYTDFHTIWSTPTQRRRRRRTSRNMSWTRCGNSFGPGAGEAGEPGEMERKQVDGWKNDGKIIETYGKHLKHDGKRYGKREIHG